MDWTHCEKTQNLRDHMSEAELIFTALAELSTRQIAETEQAKGLAENADASVQGGRVAKNARKELKTKTDYDNLFDIYKKQNLKKTISQQQRILNLLKDRKRIALTCFEANICQCHRKHLAEAIITLPEWNYELKHI